MAVEQILLEDMYIQAFGSFGQQRIGNLNQVLQNPLTLSVLTQLYGGNSTEIKHFHDRVHSDMTSKAIDVSIKNTSLKKLRLHRREYEWTDSGRLIRNDRLTML